MASNRVGIESISLQILTSLAWKGRILDVAAHGERRQSTQWSRTCPMLHVVKLIQQRHPEMSGQIIGSLCALSGLALLLGIALSMW